MCVYVCVCVCKYVNPYERASVGRPAKTYLHQLYVDTGYILKNYQMIIIYIYIYIYGSK